MENKILEAYCSSITVVNMVQELVKDYPIPQRLKYINIAYDVVCKLEELANAEANDLEYCEVINKFIKRSTEHA